MAFKLLTKNLNNFMLNFGTCMYTSICTKL